jgi:REP element-mobilizing transposase RayT
VPNSKTAKWRPHTQLTLAHRKDPTDRRGGKRPGAGRPRKPGSVSHAARAPLAPRFPQHTTLRTVPGTPSIAGEWLMKIIREVIRAAQKPTFRVVDFNVLSNHIHLVTEAASTQAMSRGVQGIKVRLARRLNAAMKRRGKLFSERFHARYLKTPREVRNCLRYVLLNRKHYDAEKKFAKYWIDPCSSAAWFDGWAEPIMASTDWKRELLEMEAPTERARTWLLSVGWRRHGLLRFDEAPS